MRKVISKMAFWRVVLFVFLIVSFGVTIRSLKQNEQKPKIPQTKLSVQLQQTKERYQEWEKEQSIKDTITELRVKMGEIQESFEDYQSRSRLDLDRFVKKQVRGN